MPHRKRQLHYIAETASGSPLDENFKGIFGIEEEIPKLSVFGAHHQFSNYAFCGREVGMREQMEDEPEKVKIT